jgi:trimeric autotransporter adhesin
LANTAISVVPVGASASSTITVTPRGGFIGSVALTCTVIGPAMAAFPPTCAIAAPTTISVTAETTATLVVNTTPASTAAVNNPLQQFFVAAASVTMAALLLPVLPLRCRWQTLLSLLVLALIVGAAGCGAINSQVIAPSNPGATNRGTTTGDYIVAVTGANGAITATTAVGVTVK